MEATFPRPVEDACCRDCSVFTRNARTLADKMQLRDWSVTVAHDPPLEPDALVTVTLHRERKGMRLRRSPAFYELDEPGRRHALTHELVHPLLRDLFEAVRTGAEQEIGGAAYRIFIGHVRLEMERASDTLAEIIAPAMPELQW